MQIVFDRKIAEQLRERYTVLELETITKDGVTLDLFCVLPTEKIAFIDPAVLETQLKNHSEFVTAIKENNHAKLKELYVSVYDSFSGELNSFYDEIVSRVNLYLSD